MEMGPESLDAMRQLVDVDQAEVVDHRSTGGEVVSLPLLGIMPPRQVLSTVADNLSWFMEKLTGRGYQKAEEVYEVGFIVREPGHECYGLKVTVEENSVVVSRVAVLEDDTTFARYVRYLHSGVFV